MDLEPQLNKIRGARYLKTLRFKMKQIIQQRQSAEKSVKENSNEFSDIPRRSLLLEIVDYRGNEMVKILENLGEFQLKKALRRKFYCTV